MLAEFVLKRPLSKTINPNFIRARAGRTKTCKNELITLLLAQV